MVKNMSISDHYHILKRQKYSTLIIHLLLSIYYYLPMKTLKINFSHPFKGHALIKMLGTKNALCKHFFVDSKESSLIEIPLTDFRNGKYEVMLDWEIDNRIFTHQQNFEINDKPNFNPSTS